jgi:PIN domain nuclease of toxin-antitoxin system
MILDTCALLWLAQGGGKLSRSAARRIDAAPIVYVSAISGFEIGTKYRQGKLELPAVPADWFKAVLAHHGVDVFPLDLPICIRATELPAVHRDPCDRLIIATAQLHGLPVVTADPVFREYDVEVIS